MEARSNPRRKRESTEDVQPLFLKKCFHMISNANPEIASWSDDGNSFIIKDVQRFASEVIPTIYKHNKFSSFVRQLNFYGFRKIKSNILQDPNWWEFKNQYFRRDDIDAISKIKKSAHFDEGSANNEINNLKSHVYDLDSRISTLDHIVEDLSHSIQQMQPFYTNNTNMSHHHPIMDSTYGHHTPSSTTTLTNIHTDLNTMLEPVDHTKKRKMVIESSTASSYNGMNPSIVPSPSQMSSHTSIAYNSHSFDQYPHENTESLLNVEDEVFSLDWLNFDEDNTTNNNNNINLQPTEMNSSNLLIYTETRNNISEHNNISYNDAAFMDSSTTTSEESDDYIQHFNTINTEKSHITTPTLNQQQQQVAVISTSSLSSTIPITARSINTLEQEEQSTRIIQSAEIKDIPSLLSLLPNHLQERFVDRLASSLGDQLAKQMNLTPTPISNTVSPISSTIVPSPVTTTTTINKSNMDTFSTSTNTIINNNTLPTSVSPMFSDMTSHNKMLMDANQSLATAALGALFTTCHLANNSKHMNRTINSTTTTTSSGTPTTPTTTSNTTTTTASIPSSAYTQATIPMIPSVPLPISQNSSYSSHQYNNTSIPITTTSANHTMMNTMEPQDTTTITTNSNNMHMMPSMMPLSQDMINLMAMNMINTTKQQAILNSMTAANTLEIPPSTAIPVCCSFCAAHGG